jgi:N-acetylmuramoyl-L-alanine amidase CwlA
MCDRHLTRRDLMKGAMAMSSVAVAGGLPLVLPEQAEAAVAEPRIYSCSEWGARSASVTFLAKKPTYIVIHHTATSNSTATTQAAAFSLARSIQNYHMNTNGWADTGQQFTVSRGGYAMEGRHRSLEGLHNKTGFPQGAHVGAGTVNSNSIGIENEGLYTSVAPPAALYNKLVDMCAYICSQFGLNPTSAIKGHRDFMATACPGNVLYSKLPQLRNDVQAKLNAGGGTSYNVTVDNSSTRFTASGNWGTSSWSSQKNGANYRYANPTPASDAAWYKFNIPSTGSYYVDAWWPADVGYNNLTPYVIVASGGNQSKVVSQRTNGGKWNNLGTFKLAAGDYNAVGVSRWTSGTGYVIADAVRIRKT